MIDLVILDVNGTLFPLDPVRDRFREVGLEAHFDLWFTRILQDGFAAAAAETFASFSELARHHLIELFDQHGVESTQRTVDDILDGFQHVTAHPDVAPALRHLTDAGVVVTTMTNGSVETTRSFLSRSGLDHSITANYDVAMAGRWKPTPLPYQYVLRKHGLHAENAALVSIHPWDIQGAISAGLSGAWINRMGARYPDTLSRPTLEATTMTVVVEQLISSP